MSNYIFPKTKITTHALLLFSITVIVAGASFLVMLSAKNGSNLRRQISGRTPEIILAEINEHVEQQEDAIDQHVQNSQSLFDQHMEQAEMSWNETKEQSNQLFEEIIPAK